MSINRRLFITGAAAIAVARPIPALALPYHDFLEDMNDVRLRFAEQVPEKWPHYQKPMNILIKLVEEKMKKWGTYRPPRQMEMIGWDENGVETRTKMTGWWESLNTFGESFLFGGKLYGINSLMFSFDHPTSPEMTATVRYDYESDEVSVKLHEKAQMEFIRHTEPI